MWRTVVVIFPSEPPVALCLLAERPAAVKGAPDVGAAKRTLDREDRSATQYRDDGRRSGKITFPVGELRALSYAAFPSSCKFGSFNAPRY